jgi:hypothetical protein
MSINVENNNPIQELYTDRSQRPISKEWRYCFIYFLVIISMLTVMVLNLLATFNSFESSKVYIFDSKQICDEQISYFLSCMGGLSSNNNDDCGIYSILVQSCFDEVDTFNKRCGVYISEFCTCKNIHNITSDIQLHEYCEGEVSDIQNCNINTELKIEPTINSCNI